MKKFLSFAGALLLPFLVLAQPGPVGKRVDGIVAVVGKEIVLQSDVEAQQEAMAREFQQMGRPAPTFCAVLGDLMTEKLLLHHAEIDSIVIADAEVDENIGRRLEQLIAQIGSQKRLEEYYKKSVVEIKEEMRPMMKNQMTAQRMQFTITEKIEVTPQDVAEFVRNTAADSLPLISAEVEFAVLIIKPKVSEKAEEESIERLKSLKARVEKGSSFSTLAILYSEDPGSNKSGGEYKGIKRGQFVKEFEAVAFNLKPGEVSDPFETEYGYHIVQLIVKRGEELDLRHILIKPKVEQKDMTEAKTLLDSVRSAIESGSMTFEKAVSEFSEDKETKLNGGVAMNPATTDVKWDIADLSVDIAYIVENLKIGELSPAALTRTSDGSEMFRLVKLTAKSQPHRANLQDDYNRLKIVAENVRKAEKMKSWLKEKAGTTYVRVLAEYEQCTLPF